MPTNTPVPDGRLWFSPFVDAVLKGLGQIMLQGNRWSGVFILAGLWLGGWHFGAAALLGAGTGTLTARLLRFRPADVQAGLYGFSASLVGVVLVFHFKATWFVWALVVVGAAIATMLQHFFIRRGLPGFTFPFVLVAWVLIPLLRTFTAPASSAIAPLPTSNALALLSVGTNGYGQVIFQGHALSGVLFFFGVLAASPRAALVGLLATFAGACAAWCLHLPLDQILAGLFGFNAVLTGIAFAEQPHRSHSVVVAVVITLVLQFALVLTGWLDPFGGALTFPFVAGSWLTLAVSRRGKK